MLQRGGIHVSTGQRVLPEKIKNREYTNALKRGKAGSSLWGVSSARIIHECRREAAETEARRGFSQVRPTQADLRSVEETEREKPRRARGSAAVVGIHE
jgi:hypothetical protein